MTQSFSQKVARLFEIRDRFEAGARCTVLELAKEFGVSRRTIFRDIVLLRELNLPLAVDKKSGAYFLPAEMSERRTTPVGEREAAILLLAAQVSPLNEVPGGRHLIRNASARLLNQLSAADRTKVGKLLSLCVQEATDGSEPDRLSGKVLLDIVSGLQGRGSVELTFRDAEDRLTTASVFLRELKLGGDGWYVVGRHIARRESIRVRLDRIREVSGETQTADLRAGDSMRLHEEWF